MARFVIYRDLKNEYRWRLKANNGEIIAVSGEGYTQKHNAVSSMNLVKNLAYNAEVADLTATNGLSRLLPSR